MADIKQAAKWLQEGKRVRRPRLADEISLSQPDGREPAEWWVVVYEGDYRARDQRLALFTSADLLADDWEIAEKAGSK